MFFVTSFMTSQINMFTGNEFDSSSNQTVLETTGFGSLQFSYCTYVTEIFNMCVVYTLYATQ